jgi:hypothetical protein
MNLNTTFPTHRTLTACVSALALMFTACGGGSDEAADTTVAATEPAPVESEPPATEPPATEAPPATDQPETTSPDDPDGLEDQGPDVEQKVSTPEDAQLAIIFDASGSVKAALDGSTRLAVAKDAIDQIVSETATFNTSLWAYGHRLPDSDPETCRDIENLVAFAPDNADAVVSAVADLEAQGDTPITDAVRTVADSFTAPESGRRTPSARHATISGDQNARSRPGGVPPESQSPPERRFAHRGVAEG